MGCCIGSNGSPLHPPLTTFFKKDKNIEKAEEITVAKVFSSSMKETTNAELRFPVNEIDKSHGRPKKYQKEIPKNSEKGSWKSCIVIWNIVSHKKIFRNVSEIYVY